MNMNNTGTVQTHVFVSRANLPLPGATVTVTRRTDAGGEELIAVQQTDSSGTTPLISVSTPETAESQSPGAGKGYSFMDITADLPGYEQVTVRDVQVFPGILTLQEIQLLPTAPLFGPSEQGQEFTVSPQNL